MARIGTFKFNDGATNYEIPVYDTVDVPDDYLRVDVAGTTGILPITDPASAAYNNIRIQTPQKGLMALHDTLPVTMIEDFETDLGGWVDNNSEWTIGTTPYEGSQNAVVSKGTSGNSAMNNTPTSGSLPYYPVRGDIFGCKAYISTTSGNAGILFGVQETRNTYPHGYHLEIDNRYDGALDLTFNDPSTGVSAKPISVPIDFTGHYGTWVDIIVEWGNPVISVRCEDANGNVLASGSYDESNATYTPVDSGGVGVSFDLVSGGGEVRHDFFRKFGVL